MVTCCQGIVAKLYPMLNTGAFNTRLSELRDMGVAYEVKTMKCPVSGREVIQWDVTTSLPTPLKKRIRKTCPHCQGKGHVEEILKS